MMVSTKEGGAMLKKYIVRLTDEERETLKQVVGKFTGSSQKVRRAQVLLKMGRTRYLWVPLLPAIAAYSPA